MAVKLLILIGFLLPCAVVAFAQKPVQSGNKPAAQLPDSPSAVAAKSARSEPTEMLADDPYQPLSPKQKLHYWIRRTYAPATFISAGVDTTYTQITGAGRYCCGAAAWGKQYGATVLNAETRYFLGRFLFPTLLKQDPRYIPKRKGSKFNRVVYSVSRVIITRNDQGQKAPDYSGFMAIAFTTALTNAYYPERDRTFSRTFNDIFGTLQGDAIGYLLTEFKPEIKAAFRRHAPKSVQKIGDRVNVP